MRSNSFLDLCLWWEGPKTRSCTKIGQGTGGYSFSNEGSFGRVQGRNVLHTFGVENLVSENAPKLRHFNYLCNVFAE